jgi:hypothetical protein
VNNEGIGMAEEKKGENKELQEIPEVDLIHLSNIHFIMQITGKVTNKEYVKSLKRILFRIETPPEFINEPTLSIKRVIFQFGMVKKLYRKYKKILYDGNNVSVGGVIGSIVTTENQEGIECRQYFIDALTVEEARIEIPKIPQLEEV